MARGRAAAPPPNKMSYCHIQLKISFPEFLSALLAHLLGEEKALMIQTLHFVAGFNTLTQTLFGTRLPAIIGGSYTFVPTTLSIVLARQHSDALDPHEKFKKIMRGIQGAIIVASTLQIVIGFSGLWRNVIRFLSPLLQFHW